MSIVLPTPDAALAARFAGGDENALATLYRQQYDGLLSAARHILGDNLAHYSGRVAHKAMLDAWEARSRFENPAALGAFLEEAVQQESDIQRRKHAALHHHGNTGSHVTVPDVEEAMRQLLAAIHAPKVDHATALAEARATKRAHAKAHVERVGGRPRWVLPVLGVIVVGAAIVLVQRWVNRAGADIAVDRAFKGEDVQTLTSGKGQRGTLTLRDGTKATMGSESVLRIPSEFATTQRTVLIEGTATFAVTPDTSAKALAFAVRAGNATVTAKGTNFTVRYYPPDSTVYVQVADGTVNIRDRVRGTQQDLKAGDALKMSADGTVSTLAGVERDVAMAWTRDSIVFDNTPLKAVVPELIRWFSLDAVLADSTIGDRPVSMRVALASSGDATKALTQAANLGITFGKNDRLEFRDASAVPAPAAGAKKKR
ncbi:FecR domain-containing protein [Gemmatimonas aurantiaca]|uniref:FecR domain-containing protein n=1 Tax=Gemmatimonas aurantiaca TaxID=173480 RepID=UPI00301BC9E1